MKRKFVIFIGGAAIVIGAAVNLNLGSNNGYLSDLTLANVEALAKYEDGTSCRGLCTKDPSKDCEIMGSFSCTAPKHRSTYD